MSDDDELEQVNHLVPKSVKRDATSVAEWGELSDAVRAVYESFANSGGDEEVVRLEAELHRVQTHREALDEQLESLREERDSLAEQEAALTEQLKQAKSEAESFESLVSQLVEMLDRGESIWQGHATVVEAAKVKSISRSEVIDVCRDRRPELPDERFTKGKSDGVEFTSTGE